MGSRLHFSLCVICRRDPFAFLSTSSGGLAKDALSIAKKGLADAHRLLIIFRQWMRFQHFPPLMQFLPQNLPGYHFGFVFGDQSWG